MSSLSVALPLRRSSIDGFQMNKDIRTLVQQNLKMLILTNPGERVMIPEYGIGVRKFLFEQEGTSTLLKIDSAMRAGIQKFMPVINIVDILYDSSNIEENSLGIRLLYKIPSVNSTELLQITI